MTVRRTVEIQLPCSAAQLRHFSDEIDIMTDSDRDVRVRLEERGYGKALVVERDVDE